MPADAFARIADAAPVLVDAAVRGAIVLLAALALTHALRRRNAASRHLIWVGAIVVQLALPVFAIWGPKWSFAVPTQLAAVLPVSLPQESPAASLDINIGAIDAGTPAPVARSLAEKEAATAGGPALSPATNLSSLSNAKVEPPVVSGRDILLALWALGTFVILVRLAIGTTIVARLAKKGNRVDDGNWLSLAQKLSANLGIDRPLTLLRGNKLAVPVTWGIVYPVVLLPEGADAWPEERRKFVLVHEMAHVKRLDALTQLAGQLALALFWFNPLVWIANRRMQLEREHACDDYVLRHGTAASMYAEELLQMVRSIGASEENAQPAFAALAMARRSEFEGRMLSILDPVLDRHPLSRSRALLSALAALLFVVPLAALQPYQPAAAFEEKPPASVPTKQDAADSTTPTVLAKPAPSDLPESFKVKILPATDGGVSIAPVAPMVSAPPMRNASTATAPPAPARAAMPTCDVVRFGEKGTSSVQIHADDSGPLINYHTFNGSRCADATILGALKYSANEDDIVAMPFGARASLRERTASIDREIDYSRSSTGEVVRRLRVDGKEQDYDDDAKKWVGTLLPKILMDAGYNTDARIARWRSQGGIDYTLSVIEKLNSSGTKRSHYHALIDQKLSAEDADKVLRSASRAITSSGDLRSILMKVAPTARLSRQSANAVENALMSMASSGDKTAVLHTYAQTDDREMLLGVMRVAETIASSGDRSRLLQIVAPRYLAKNDEGLETAWFRALQGLASSGDQQNALMIARKWAPQSPGITRQIIVAAKRIPSSGDQARVLIALVSSGAVNTKELKDAFFSAAAAVPSDGDRARVLQAAMAGNP